MWQPRSPNPAQVAEMLRRSATDIDAPGFDPSSGWGLLSVPAALEARAPIRDPQEPNDDVDLVADGGLFSVGTPPLVDEETPHTRVAARLDPADDPTDVYRLWLPAGREVVAKVDRGPGVQLTLWGPHTRSIQEGGSLQRRDRIGDGRTVRTRSIARAGAYYYLVASLPKGAPRATYLVSVSLGARR
jgi:hypothetical protein